MLRIGDTTNLCSTCLQAPCVVGMCPSRPLPELPPRWVWAGTTSARTTGTNRWERGVDKNTSHDEVAAYAWEVWEDVSGLKRSDLSIAAEMRDKACGYDPDVCGEYPFSWEP